MMTKTQKIIKASIHMSRKYTIVTGSYLEYQMSTRGWNQWLAGFIDADGALLINKRGLSCCEITTHVDNTPILREIQTRCGGSVKARAGNASVRWRLTNRDEMINLCNRINGHIRLGSRRKQLERVCALLNLIYQPPVNLTIDSGYMAGLFDGDGSVTIMVNKTSAARSILPGIYGKIMRLCYSRNHHQISVHIDSVDRNLLESCRQTLHIGKIIRKSDSADTAQRRLNVHYRWYWSSHDHVCAWQAYLTRVKACHHRSVKHRRLLLVEQYFELISQQCHYASENSTMFQRWSKFCHNWYS